MDALAPAVSPAPEWLDTAAYPFTHRFADVGPGRMHYVDEGSGAPILFVHGTPTWSFEYRHLVKALSPRYRCVAPDHLGFGLSDRPAADRFGYTPEAHAETLATLVEALDLRDLTLVVHDFGGPIALPLALRPEGRVKRLVVLNSWMWSFEDDARMVKQARIVGGGLGRFLYGWLNFSLRVLLPSVWGDRRTLTKHIHRQYLEPFRDRAAREDVLWALARSLLGSSAHYRSLWERRAALEALPSLVLWGMKDTAFPPTLLERWRTALPRAQFKELPAAGHWPHEEAPDEVARAIGDFLSRGGMPVTVEMASATTHAKPPAATAD